MIPEWIYLGKAQQRPLMRLLFRLVINQLALADSPSWGKRRGDKPVPARVWERVRQPTGQGLGDPFPLSTSTTKSRTH